MNPYGTRRELRRFDPCQPPQVVRDNTLSGAPVLLLGWWLDADGRPETAVVLSLTTTRAPADLAGLHGERIGPGWAQIRPHHSQGEN